MKKKLLLLALALACLSCLFVIGVAAEGDTTPSLSVNYTNLSFKDSVYIKYAVAAENVAPEDVRLLVFTEPQDDYTDESKATVLMPKYLDTVNGAEHIIFDYTNLAARQMTDEVYACAMVKVGNKTYYSNIKKYSILQYATSAINNPSAKQSLKNMLAGMLDYGALAQTHFAYKADRPANASWVNITVENGTLSDGFTTGMFITGDTLTLTPAEAPAGKVFSHWENAAGEIQTLPLTAPAKNETYTAVYVCAHEDVTEHAAKAPTCTEIGWDAYVTCDDCDYTTHAEIPALGHDEVSHAAKPVSCTEIGWDAYVTCTRCDYTTYVEQAALGHDMQDHEAQAPTCTTIGWDAYTACSRCDVTTCVEKAALGHDEVTCVAKEPTVTEIGWMEYVTCTRCDYTTYVELPAIGNANFTPTYVVEISGVTIQNVGTGQYLNNDFGTLKNKNIVRVWPWDGSREQLFDIDQVGAYTYRILTNESSSFAVDIYRNGAKLAAGQLCDIWEAGDDAVAQNMQFYDCGDGSYILCMESNKNLVLSAPGDKKQLKLAKFNPDDSSQRWIFKDANGNNIDITKAAETYNGVTSDYYEIIPTKFGGETYTIDGAQYYRAKLVKEYNGVKAAEEFLLDANKRVVTNPDIIRKVKAMVVMHAAWQNASTWAEFSKEYYNIYIEIQESETYALLVGKVTGVGAHVALGEPASIAKASFSAVKDISVDTIKKAAYLAILNIYVEESVRYSEIAEEYSKNLDDYDSALKAYDAYINSYACFEALSFLIGEDIEDMANSSFWKEFVKNLNSILESFCGTIIPENKVVEALQEAWSTGKDLVLGIGELAVNYGADQKYADAYNLFMNPVKKALNLTIPMDEIMALTSAPYMDSKRQTVISYMTDMATVQWTAGASFTSYMSNVSWKNGKTYYGIPYSQNTSILNSVSNTRFIALSTFETMLNDNGGLISQDIGRNDCSYAVCKAWSRVDSDVHMVGTASMYPGSNNIVAVGSYTYKTNKATTCTYNGESTMFAAYACLKPGDAVVRDGHTMLVVGVNPASQKITVIHQSGNGKYYDGTKTVNNSTDPNTSWGINEEISYNTLFSDGYIPITCEVLANGEVTENWDDLVGQTLASIKSDSGYTKWYGSENVSAKYGYDGQCTWYALGRFYEVTGVKLTTAPNAKLWLTTNANNSKVNVVYGAANIVAKSIAVDDDIGNYGHVLFIEHVTYDANGNPKEVYFTECNWDCNGVYNAGKDCILQKMTYSTFVSKRSPDGYIIAK